MYIGVDGSKNQWVAALLDSTQEESTIRYVQVEHLEELWAEFGMTCRKLLIDMPLGLSSSGKRRCDELVMDMLGPANKKRCFHAPSYNALEEWRRLTRAESNGEPARSPIERYNAINGINVTDTQMNLTPPGYALVPRIANVRDFVLSIADRSVVSEAHPEVCFLALSNRERFSSKHHVPGLFERLAVIQSHIPNFINDVASGGDAVWNQVSAKMDDVLDATVLALTARMMMENPASTRRITNEPPLNDQSGIPIEIVYAEQE
ncbi:DUF429 domain-containing protein [Paenibacillus sp. CF384]|uniref:DUF429 domain-containing protein n=1 Tax=Paenibacillus sp. CF384 TaxID=1884382 RepID=UPI0008991934|nr:DUF429 domain-containing protein [Paenibacillus sp. CF384]SDX94242.1 Predicted nuclease (RNAse H fold) [Paenibacillus sp. CF384]